MPVLSNPRYEHFAQAAARLLRRAKPIIERVRELQAEANARQIHKIDLSRERVGRKLDKASQLAEAQNNAAAMVSAELGIAEVFGHVQDEPTPQDFTTANSMQDIGRKLLQSVGLSSLMMRASPPPSRPTMPLWLRSRRYEIALRPRSMVEGAEQPSALPR
jgi:fumarylacetoacetate (FAA) hydrolase family protein